MPELKPAPEPAAAPTSDEVSAEETGPVYERPLSLLAEPDAMPDEPEHDSRRTSRRTRRRKKRPAEPLPRRVGRALGRVADLLPDLTRAQYVLALRVLVGVVVIGVALVAIILVGAHIAPTEDSTSSEGTEESSTTLEALYASQSGVGGGSMVSDGAYLYWVGGDGVYALVADEVDAQLAAAEAAAAASTGDTADATTADDTSDDDETLLEPVLVWSGQASCLNVCGDDLYLVSGDAVLVVRDVREGIQGLTEGDEEGLAAATLYEAEGCLEALLVRDELVLVVELADGVATLADVATGSATRLVSLEASAAWAFCDVGQDVALCATTEDGWSLVEESLDDLAALVEAGGLDEDEELGGFVTVASGTGELACAFFDGSALTCAVSTAGGGTRVLRYEGGNQQDLASLSGVVVLAGSSELCAGLTQASTSSSSRLVWVSASSGLPHDATAYLTAAGVSVDASSCSVWCDDTAIYLISVDAEGAGTVYVVDVKADTVAVAKVCG